MKRIQDKKQLLQRTYGGRKLGLLEEVFEWPYACSSKNERESAARWNCIAQQVSHPFKALGIRSRKASEWQQSCWFQWEWLQVEHLGGHGSSPGNGSLDQCGKGGNDGNGHDGNSIRILRSQPTEQWWWIIFGKQEKGQFQGWLFNIQLLQPNVL